MRSAKVFGLAGEQTFNDEDRNVEYTLNRETIISDLQIGDEGAFLLMYQDDPGPEGSVPQVIKEFPFSYGY